MKMFILKLKACWSIFCGHALAFGFEIQFYSNGQVIMRPLKDMKEVHTHGFLVLTNAVNRFEIETEPSPPKEAFLMEEPKDDR